MNRSSSRAVAFRVAAAAAVVVLATGCATRTAGQTSSGPRQFASTARTAVLALPAGTVGAVDGHALMVNVSDAGSATLIRGYDRATHALVRTVRLPGRYTLPWVVPAGPTEGFAHNGSVFVLVGRPTASISRFAVLDGMLDAPARVVDLPQAFSYDALAPDGTTLYLIEHLAPRGSQHYQVRSYDLTAQRLDDAVIVDKTHLDEEMAGHPTSRVTSADGTVVSTMYERAGDAPFIHVLHTADRSAQCIDLPVTRGRHLAGEGNVLTIQDDAGLVRLTVDLVNGTTAAPTP